jgi:hypothetical protein
MPFLVLCAYSVPVYLKVFFLVYWSLLHGSEVEQQSGRQTFLIKVSSTSEAD